MYELFGGVVCDVLVLDIVERRFRGGVVGGGGGCGDFWASTRAQIAILDVASAVIVLEFIFVVVLFAIAWNATNALYVFFRGIPVLGE